LEKWQTSNILTDELPNGEKAVIPEGKLADYCLSPLHPDGKHKAKVFEKALGITKENSFQLQNLVLESAKYGEVRNEQKNEFGKIYRVEYEISGINQREILRTLWIVHSDSDIPYLTSCFIKRRR